MVDADAAGADDFIVLVFSDLGDIVFLCSLLAVCFCCFCCFFLNKYSFSKHRRENFDMNDIFYTFLLSGRFHPAHHAGALTRCPSNATWQLPGWGVRVSKFIHTVCQPSVVRGKAAEPTKILQHSTCTRSSCFERTKR